MFKYFEIIEMDKPKKSSTGRLFLKCKTKNRYSIAFWGIRHAAKVQQQKVPFRVSCKVKKAPTDSSIKTNVKFWVIENQELEFSPSQKK